MLTLNPLGTEGAEAKFWLPASNIGRVGGGGLKRGTPPPLLLRCTAVPTHPWAQHTGWGADSHRHPDSLPGAMGLSGAVLPHRTHSWPGVGLLQPLWATVTSALPAARTRMSGLQAHRTAHSPQASPSVSKREVPL